MTDKKPQVVIASGWPPTLWAPVHGLLRDAGWRPLNADPHAATASVLVSTATTSGELPIEHREKLIEQLIPNGAALGSAPTDLQLLSHWARGESDATFLIFYSRLLDGLASAIAQGQDPDAFCVEWQSANETMLKFQRRVRSRCMVFDSAQVPGALEQFASVCASRGVDFVIPPSGVPRSISSHPRPLDVLLARYILENNSDLLLLDAELQATAHPLLQKGEPTVLSAETVIIDFNCRVREQSKLLKEKSSAVSEIVDLKAALETTTRKLAAEQATSEQLQSEFATEKQRFSSQLRTTQERLKEAREAIADAELHAVEQKNQFTEQSAVLAEKVSELMRLSAENEKLNDLARSLDLERSRVLGSSQRECTRLKKENQALDEERQLLFDQLTIVQEGLEEAYESRLSAEETAASQQRQFAQLTHANQEALAHLTDAQAQVAQLVQANKDAETHLARSERQLLEAQNAEERSRSSAEKLGKENERVLEQLNTVQQSLEIQFHERSKISDCLSREQRRLAKLTVDAFLNTTGHNPQSANSGYHWSRLFRLKTLVSRWQLRRLQKIPGLSDAARARVLESGLFDYAWYLQQYPDVRLARCHPADHYLVHGGGENRDPGPGFSSADYCAANPSLIEAGINPLLHSIAVRWRDNALLPNQARAEKKPAGPTIKAFVEFAHWWQLRRLRRLSGTNPYERACLMRSPLFDWQWYLEQYPDVRAAKVHPADHFLKYGGVENRNPSTAFDIERYLQEHPALRDSETNPLLHFLASRGEASV